MKPILMSGPLVRATLEGRKTQTRRVIRPQPPIWWKMRWPPFEGDEIVGMHHTGESYKLKCPYSKPGDILWVRETWNEFPAFKGVHYAADDYFEGIGEFDDPDHIKPQDVRWKPSIHMPKAFCRLFLRVKDIWVEGVQDITVDDIMAEGAWNPAHSCDEDYREVYEAWVDLWDSINEKRGYGWDVNPWVWVVEYSMIDKPLDT